jgi:beta-lactamase regulating signal transducer with metallopeptidase domain
MNAPDWIEWAGAWVWRTSLEASVLILLILGLRMLGRNRLSPRFLMVLWAILGVRLILPVAVQSPFSVSEVLPIRELETLPQAFIFAGATDMAGYHMGSTESSAGSAFDAPTGILHWIWLSGMMLLMLVTATRHFLARAAICRLRPVTDPQLLEFIGRSGIPESILPVTSPGGIAIFGALQASHLLLPERLTETHSNAQILAILHHEREHLRRHDLAWNAVLFIVQTLHWFNPLVWISGRLFQNDREMACDAAALREASGIERRHYGEALLTALAGDRVFSPVPALLPFFSRKHELQQRLTTIMKNPHYKLVPHLLASVLTLVFVAGTFTSPVSQVLAEEGVPADGPKEGQAPQEGARDGDAPKVGPKDGDAPKVGPKDGEMPKEGPKDGDVPKAPGEGDQGAAPKEGERPAAANNANKKELGVFNAYDKNSDGQVSAEEMEAMIESKQNSSGRREIRKAISRADKDDNEQLNFEEFLFWYKVGRLDDNAENRG